MHVTALKGDMSCLASDNKKWEKNQQKCVDCPSCLLGKARNFSEKYFGPSVSEGDTLCLPCRECPEGFFAGENECQPCKIVCDTDFKREYDEICEESHDAECGSCLFGYVDIYTSAMLPCYLPQENHNFSAPISNNLKQSVGNETGINNLNQTANSSSVYPAYFTLAFGTAKTISDNTTNNEVNSDETNFSVFGIPVPDEAKFFALFLFFFLILILFWRCYVRYNVVQQRLRQRRRENIEASETLNDIQTDGGDSPDISLTEVECGVRLGRTVVLYSASAHPFNEVSTHHQGYCSYSVQNN